MFTLDLSAGHLLDHQSALDKPAKASVAVDRRDKVTRTGEDVQDLPFFACSRFNRKPVVFAEQFSAYYVT